jgi:hypothetical protein
VLLLNECLLLLFTSLWSQYGKFLIYHRTCAVFSNTVFDLYFSLLHVRHKFCFTWSYNSNFIKVIKNCSKYCKTGRPIWSHGSCKGNFIWGSFWHAACLTKHKEKCTQRGLLDCRASIFTLKMAAARSFETLASYHNTTQCQKRSLNPEDGSNMVLRNVGIVHHYTVSHTKRPLQPEDGVSMVLRNVYILPHHYTVSQTKTPL